MDLNAGGDLQAIHYPRVIEASSVAVRKCANLLRAAV